MNPLYEKGCFIWQSLSDRIQARKSVTVEKPAKDICPPFWHILLVIGTLFYNFVKFPVAILSPSTEDSFTVNDSFFLFFQKKLSIKIIIATTYSRCWESLPWKSLLKKVLIISSMICSLQQTKEHNF